MPSGSIWIDITELFDHFRITSHPTGVSRTVLSVADALIAEPGLAFRDIRPLFWHPLHNCPLTITDRQLLPLSEFFPKLAAYYAEAGFAFRTRSRAAKVFATSMPRSLRYRLFPGDNGVVQFARWAQRHKVGLAPVSLGRGDCLFLPGSFWLGRYLHRLLAHARTADVQVTAFIHDVLPLSHPEWLPRRHSEQFRRGYETLLPNCAAIICNSQYTRAELPRYLALPEHLAIQTCRLADAVPARPAGPHAGRLSEYLHQRYVLFVSTLIPRKNHRLLVKAWELLRARHGSATPLLLFAGFGAPDHILAHMVERQNANFCRIVILGSVDEASLETLYRHAWITAYPSLAEGFGLPVAEALSRGKACLAAPSGGIREIAPDLIDFIDPHDPASIADKVSVYLADQAQLAAREAEIKRRYRSTGWPDCARAIRRVIENTVSRSPLPDGEGHENTAP